MTTLRVLPAAGISRQFLLFWLLTLAFANVVAAKATRTAAEVGWEQATAELFAISAIVVMAISASLVLAWKSDHSDQITPTDWVIGACVLTLTFSSFDILSRLALAGTAAYLLATAARGSSEWRAGAIAASTTTYFIIGPALLTIFAREFAFADAWLVAQATGYYQDRGLVAMNDNAGWLRIARGCSSLHALSLSVILPIAYSQWHGLSDWRRIGLAALVTAIITVAFNVARLSAMAIWPLHFEFLHTGWGATVISFVTLGSMVLICVRVLRT